jgi:hypothetical protein
MKQLVRTGTFPYTPAIQSWLSVQLGLPFRQVTEELAKSLLK